MFTRQAVTFMLPMLKWSIATVKVKALGPMATPWAEIVGPWDLISAIRFRNNEHNYSLKKDISSGVFFI
jgi:hypothetical protein